MALALAMAFGAGTYLPQSAFTDSLSVTANAEVSGDWEYEYADDSHTTITLKGCKGTSTNITTPTKIGGKPVVKLRNTSKSFWGDMKEKIQSITVSEGVKEIHDDYGRGYFFGGCDKLTTLKLPSTLKEIEPYLCGWLAALKSVTISNGTEKIGREAFSHCNSLKSIKIPDSVTRIESDAFSYCENLESVVLSNNLKEITPFCFTYSGLKSITVPKSVTTIYDRAFDECAQLEKVVLSEGLKTIDYGAFGHCVKLSSLNIPKSVTDIHRNAFYYGSSWTNQSPWYTNLKRPLVFNDILYDLGDYLREYIAPENIETVLNTGTGANTSLHNIFLAQNVDIIKENAFINFGNLENFFIQSPDALFEEDALSWTKEEYRPKNLRIIAPKGSTAQEYANANNIKFAAMPDVVRAAGDNRFDTAVMVSRRTYTEMPDIKADCVVIASGLDYADALAGVPLARLYNGPLLLTAKDSITERTLNEIKILMNNSSKLKTAYILGGEGVISNDMLKQIGKLRGGSEPLRIGGKNRYETCSMIIDGYGSLFDGTAICAATGTAFPDALAGGVLAAYNSSPLYLVVANLEDSQKALLADTIADKIFVFGGKGAVSKNTEAQLIMNLKY